KQRSKAKSKSVENIDIYRGNEERNRKIIKLHTDGLSNIDISQQLQIAKNIVACVVNRYLRTGNKWSFAIKDIDFSDISLMENTEGIKLDPHTHNTHIICYKGNQGFLKHRYYLVMKAILEDQREFFPAVELMLV